MTCEVCDIVKATLAVDKDAPKDKLLAVVVVRTLVFEHYIASFENIVAGLCDEHRSFFDDCVEGMHDVLKERSEGSA